ncbi:MAG: tandem-95 repeat protein [Prosthecobacter sp.]|uniref:Ig-like domain-containing protein n=1 Tax=Prosthecobacter sp. TaxID=1965333 RepID=UPI003BB1A6D4
MSKPPADAGALKSSPPNLKPAPTAAPAVFGTREANPEVKAQPAPYIAPQKPADLAATTERARFLQDARILQERATPPDAQGNFTKKRVVEAKFKYPFLRIEESWKRDAATGVETMQEQKVMVADHFLLTLKDGVTAGELQTVLDGLGGKVRRHLPNSQVYIVETGTSDLDLYDIKLKDFRLSGAAMQIVEPDYVVFASLTPNDPSFSSLWGMNNTGQSGGVGDADIDAPEAWDVARGSSAVVVGIIDTGIDYTHPDLAANMWLNAGEIPGNGIDDDGNGYIDDMRGWDFVSNDNDPADDHYHGTHCAGTIGAVGDNGIGVAGVCHTVRLMALKFLSGSGGGSTSDAIEAVLYATANHVTLTSNSWGGGGYSQTLKNAIDAAGTAGILFVAAAGNSGINTDLSASYPASYDSANIISVAASDNADVLASFTNYGATTVDLAAPGVSIYSTSPGGGYRTLSGTSMACPHVAGACALIKSARPAMNWSDIKSSLMSNVDGVAGMTGKVAANGRMNLARALIIASEPYVTLTALQASDSGLQGGAGNNDGVLNPAEDITLAVTLKNVGAKTAKGAASTLTVTSAGNKVTVLQGSNSWGDLAVGGTASTGGTPFLIRIAADTPTPHVFSLILNTTDTDGHAWTSQAQLTVFTSSTVSGRVTAVTGGSGIAAALINYTGTSTGSVVTAADGTYSVKLTDGTYEFRATAPGYNPSASTSVTVPPNPAAVDFALGKSRIQVAPSTLASTQYEDAVATKTLTLTNNGDQPLTFDVNSVPRSSVLSMDPGTASIQAPPILGVLDAAAETQPAGVKQLMRIASGSTPLPFSDGFESGTLNGWANGSGAGTREIVSSTAASGSKSFHYNYQGSTDHFHGINRDFSPGSKPKTISFWVRSGSTTTHDGYFVLTDGTYGDDLIWFFARGSGKFYVNGDVGGDETFSYQANVWYHVEFQDLDWTAKNFDYYVNGTLVKANIPFRNAAYVDEVSQLWLYNFSTGSEAWWDDIRMMDASLNWLSQTPTGATLAPGQSTTLTVTFDATGKLAGDYLGQIDISSNDPANPVVSVPVTMTVQQQPNTPPVADAQTVTLNEDAQAVITLTGSDVDGNALTAQIQTLPAQGSLYQTSDGTSMGERIVTVPAIVSNNAKKVIFVPPPNENGTPYTSFQFAMNDKRSQSTAATVTLNVTAVNDLPVAFNDFASGLPGQMITPITVLANDIDPDGQTLTVSSFTQGLKGTVASNGDGTLSFTPSGSFTSGQDSFSYTINDGAGGSATATVTVYVGLLAAGPWPMVGGNTAHTGFYPGTLNGQTFSQAWTLQVAPQALNQVSIGEGRVFATPNIYYNETQVSAVDLATGLLAWKKTWPVQAYQMNGPAYFGGALYVQRSKSTTYTDSPEIVSINAGSGALNWSSNLSSLSSGYMPATVTDTSVFMSSGFSIGGVACFNRTTGSQQFFNNTLETGDGWTPGVYNGKVYSFVTSKFRQHNMATGAVEWMVDLIWANMHTTISHTMAIASGAAFVVNVSSASSGELVCIDLTTQAVRWRVPGVLIGTPAVAGASVYAFDTSGNVKAYDTATGTLQKTYTTGIGTYGTYQPIVTNDALIASSATSTAVHDLSTGTKIQTIAAGGIPSLSNGYLLLAGTDGVLRCYAALINTSPVATALTATCVEDQTVTLTLPGTDADSDPLAGLITALPAKGTLYQTTDGVQVGNPITQVPVIVQNPARKVIYRPAPDGFGTPYTTFKFRINDGKISSTEAAATINVTNVNDPPIAVNDTIYLRPGNTLAACLPAANDVDVDGEVLQTVSFTTPSKGSLTQNGDGSLRYVPQADFQEGSDSFQYTIQDGAGLRSTGVVQVLVSASYGTEWTQFGNGPDHTGRYPGSLGTQTWVQRWEYASTIAMTPLAVAGGKVFVAPTDSVNGYSYLIALNESTGAEVWRAQMAAGGVNPPSFYQGKVYIQHAVTNDYRVRSFDAASGAALWSTSYGSQGYRHYSPAVSDLGVCINGGTFGGIYGFDRTTGTQKFFNSTLAQYDRWTPGVYNGQVYSFVEGKLRQHHPDTGVSQWTLDLGWNWSGWSMDRVICLDSGKAYVVNNTASGSELVCVDLAGPAVTWRVSGAFTGTPAASNGVVYACSGGVVKGFNASSGRSVADYTAGTETSLNGAPVVSNDLLMIGSSSKTYIFNLATRALIQTLSFGSQIAVANDLLYLSGADNKVHVYGRGVPTNLAPVAQAAQVGILEEAEVAIKLEGTDGNGEVLSYVVRTLPTQGTLYQTTDGSTKGAVINQVPAQVLNSTGAIIYQAPFNVFGAGAGSFTFTAHDQISSSATATITVNITPVNDPPVAVSDLVALRPGEPLLNFRPEANDRDPDGDLLSVVAFTQGTSGQVTQSADGSLQYVPDEGFTTGTDAFTYMIRDAADVHATGTVSITLSTTLGRAWPTFGAGPDHTGFQPIRLGTTIFTQRWQSNQTYAARQLAIAEGRVYASLINFNGLTAQSLVAVDTASGGELWRSNFPSGTSTNPPTWFNGNVFMQNGNSYNSRFYNLNATTGATLWNSPFSAQFETYYAPAADASGVYINGGNYGGMYGFNPSSGAQLFFQSLDQYDQWTPTLYNDGLYSFVKGVFRSHNKTTGATLWNLNFGWSGGYSMNRTAACLNDRAYLVNDSVTIPAGDQELICVDLVLHSAAWKVRGKFTGTPALAHQSVFAISNGNSIKSYDATTGAYIGVYPLPGTDTGLTVQPIVTNDSVIASSATKTYVFDLGSHALRQTIAFGGNISLAGESLYIASSNGIIRAFGVPDALNHSPVALAQTATTPEDTRVTFTLQATDADNDSVNFVISTLPTLGTLYQTSDGTSVGTPITTATTLVTNAAGKVIYQPAADRFGSPLTSFQFAASDGKAVSAPVTATVIVQPVNDAPIARADARVAQPGQIVSPLRERLNDFDVDGDLLTVVSFTQPTLGTVAFNSDGTLCYRAPSDVAVGSTQFSYTITDPSGATASANVVISIVENITGAWPTFGNSPAHTGYSSSALGRTGWAQRWSYSTGSSGNNLQPVVSASGRIFASFRDSLSRVVAIDASSGAQLWSSSFASAYSMNPPTCYDGRVYVQRGNHSGDSQLIALQEDTGTTAWSAPFAAQSENYMAPAVTNLGVFVNGGTYGGIYGFALADGLQKFFLTKPQSSGWTPSILDSEVYAFVNGDFVRHNPSTGAVLWTRSLGWGGFGYSMDRTTALDSRRAYLVNDSPTTVYYDEDLTCINLDTQTVVWSVNGDFTGTPAISNGTVFALSGNVVQARLAADGSLITTYDTPSGTYLSGQPIVTDDLVIAASASNTFVFGRYDQVLLATLNRGGSPAVVDDALIISSPATGTVSAWAAQPAITFTPPGGSFDQPVGVVIGAADPTTRIHYTVDGSAPDFTSPWLVSGAPVRMSWSGKIRAISVKGSEVSRIHEASFTIADSDGDGIADWWEMQFYGSLSAATAASDSDGDGMTDLAEFKAGTDPRSALDRLETAPSISHAVPGNELVLTWKSKAGRLYIVESSSDLKNWVPVSAVLEGTGATMNQSMSMNSNATLFGRVRVLPALMSP